MRRKFLEKEVTLTLEDLFRVARSQEVVDRQMNMMVSNAGAQVNVVGESNRSARSKICFACGKDGHFSRVKRCPARGVTCRNCGCTEHFKARCRQGVQPGGGEL